MRRRCFKRGFIGALAVVIAAVSIAATALPVNVCAAGNIRAVGAVSVAGVLSAGVTAEREAAAENSEDAWAEVEKESETTGNDTHEVDEFGCRLQSWHTCYKYEYAYRTGDTSGLEGEKEMAFYEGLKGYLDYAYQFDTPYEQEKAIHDYMVLNCRYALDHLIDGKFSNDVWNYKGVFVHGQAVCQGYALAFKLCMDILGIESRVILGMTPEGKHAWNAVQLDGEWYYVDVTWDDPVPDVEGKVKYKYFNVPQWWIELEHEIKAPLEPIGTKYSADEVLTVTVGSEKKELNRMLMSHFGDLSPLALYRVYLVKEDGSPWTKEDIANYRLPINSLNISAYNGDGCWDVENGTVLCYYFQGWGTPGEFALEVLISVVVLVIPVVLIVFIVRWIRKRKKKGQADDDNLSIQARGDGLEQGEETTGTK